MASENRNKKLAGRDKSRRHGSASRAFVESMIRAQQKRAAAAIERAERREKERHSEGF